MLDKLDRLEDMLDMLDKCKNRNSSRRRKLKSLSLIEVNHNAKIDVVVLETQTIDPGSSSSSCCCCWFSGRYSLLTCCETEKRARTTNAKWKIGMACRFLCNHSTQVVLAVVGDVVVKVVVVDD